VTVASPATQASVLIVDDNVEDRLVLAEMITRLGYIPNFVADGEKALAAIASTPVEVIITELVLPRTDGFTLLKALLDRGDPTPVIVLTAYGDNRIHRMVFNELRARWVVPKPADMYILRVLLKETLRIAEPASESEGPSGIGSPGSPFPCDILPVAGPILSGGRHENSWTRWNAAFTKAFEEQFEATVHHLKSRFGVSDELASEYAQAAWERGWAFREQLRDPGLLVPWIKIDCA
jgi:CheY-like chemotaxis protein